MRCKVCSHERRHQIEVGMVLGVSNVQLAYRFGLTRFPLDRHKNKHLTPTQRAAILTALRPSEIDLEALQRDESEGLLSQLIGQRARLQTYVETALAERDTKAAVAVERSVTANLELTAKLLGQLVTHHEVRSTNVLVSADYLQLRQAIVTALQPFPEAARAIRAGAPCPGDQRRCCQSLRTLPRASPCSSKRRHWHDRHRAEAMEPVLLAHCG